MIQNITLQNDIIIVIHMPFLFDFAQSEFSSLPMCKLSVKDCNVFEVFIIFLFISVVT